MIRNVGHVGLFISNISKAVLAESILPYFLRYKIKNKLLFEHIQINNTSVLSVRKRQYFSSNNFGGKLEQLISNCF